MVHEWIKGFLRWHEEQFYTVGPVLWNDACGLADGKFWVSMPLSRNGFTMLIRLTFLAFGLSTNVSLMLLISWLLALYAQSTLWVMANHMYMALQQSSARPNWSVHSLTLLRLGLVSSLLLVLKEPDAYVWNTANGWILCWSRWCLVCVSLMASHLFCGQTNYYITVSQPVVNQVTNDL